MKGRMLDKLSKEELLSFTTKHVRGEFVFWWRAIRDVGFQDILGYCAEAGLAPEELIGIILIFKLFERDRKAGELSIREAWAQAKTMLPLEQPVIKQLKTTRLEQ